MYIFKRRQYALLSIIVVTLIVTNTLEIGTMAEESGTNSGGGMTSGESIDVNSLPEVSSPCEDEAQEIPLGVPMSSEDFRQLKQNAEQPSPQDERVEMDEDK